MYFIGDVHGCFNDYQELVKKFDSSLQVGDVGNGFPDRSNSGKLSRSPELDLRHKFIRGNHDSPEVCREHPNYLGEYGFDEKSNIFYIGGGYSIDWEWRVEGISIWEDEELPMKIHQDIFDLYKKSKPMIVVSHECPTIIKWHVLTNIMKKDLVSRTEHLLKSLFEEYQPKYWIFGHHHRKVIKKIDGTLFVGLGEMLPHNMKNGTHEIAGVNWG
jgi:Icc-related predicted phosphoesterase